MTVYLENETEYVFPFPAQELAEQVVLAVLDLENCPYETQVNMLVTDGDGIRSYNRRYRGIDAETDVLSFPGIAFEREADFSVVKESAADYFDPDTGELILGDIVLSAPRVFEQAEKYGHSVRREFAFLTAHSMFHLCGYDHETQQEAARMEEKQERILTALGITREKGQTGERET